MHASIEVGSCGLLPGGRSVPPQVVEAASLFGADLAGHRSIQISEQQVSEADLVVTMTRQHQREVVLQFSDAWSRTFTLAELLQRGEEVGPRSQGQLMVEWFEELHRGRRRQDMVGTSREGDISDPYGGPDEGYRRMAHNLAELLDRLAVLIWPVDGSNDHVN